MKGPKELIRKRKCAVLSRTGQILLLAALSEFACFAQAVQNVSPWSLPLWQFQNVDEKGHLSVWQSLGDLPLGYNYKIPIGLGFCSDRGQESAYAGKGWIFPLFESTIYQLDENAFLLIQPDGQKRHLVRSAQGGATLIDGSGWEGNISGDSIAIKSAFGWVIDYQNGKISDFTTPDGQKYTIKRSELGDSLVGPNDEVLIGITFSGSQNQDTIIQLPSGAIHLEEASKPHIQSQMGLSVVDHVDKSLSAIHLPNGKSISYKYGVDKTLCPTMRISDSEGDRNLTWNPASQEIISDDLWTYKVSSPSDTSTSVVRTDKSGKSESWSLDRASGVESDKSVTGALTTRRYFTNGPLDGKVRDEVIDESGKKPEKSVWSYDENGRLIRFSKNGASDMFNYGNDGKVKSITDSRGKSVTKLYDQSGSYVGQETLYPNGSRVRLFKDTATSMLMSFSIPKQGFVTMPVSPESASSLYGDNANPLPNDL